MRTALILLLALMALPASAQTPACDPNQPQIDLSECHAREAARWDELLNIIYRRVIQTLDADGEVRLREAQRAWITYRDLTCEMERMRYAGGSIAPMIQSQCVARLTEQRTRDLELYMRP
ncbi:lysozyme inhibitor LprI family protein [Jannaschia sp. CCS1]|uniref:lysozyme inhibitor LprI family protein n=1 Tax=Jannaschia sp. (strain CCS1) TaxID=290400 RepID=UPI000053CCF3|nr:lysozyme inhibitor LprI family protein [Jannaschia sp. CCS1]ABD54665.1 protein of unknown function DUF1311 [Jannaschia sp. CCS1]